MAVGIDSSRRRAQEEGAILEPPSHRCRSLVLLWHVRIFCLCLIFLVTERSGVYVMNCSMETSTVQVGINGSMYRLALVLVLSY